MVKPTEETITKSPPPVSQETLKKINSQLERNICKIERKGNFVTGFFTKTENGKKLLITSSNISKDIKENGKIKIILNEGEKTINVDDSRNIFINNNNKSDIAIIEILEKDNIKDFLEIDENTFNKDPENIFKRKPIYILQYSNKPFVSFGVLNNIFGNEIYHLCNTQKGSLGSPILDLLTNKVIGVHNGDSRYIFKIGTFLKESIHLFQANYNNNILSFDIPNSPIVRESTFNKNKEKESYNFEPLERKINSSDDSKRKRIDSKKTVCFCKKCKTVPKFNYNPTEDQFFSSCKCNKNEKYLKIDFINYLIHGKTIKCEKHKKIFSYYCQKCGGDICDDCLLKSQIHSSHKLNIFDLLTFDAKIQIERIKEHFKNQKNKNTKVLSFIDVLMNGIDIFPNNNLFLSIENIYNSLFSAKKEITTIKNFKKIKEKEKITSILFIGQNLQNIELFKDKNLSNLNALSLQKNNIRDLSPLSKCKLENLQFLDLSFNEIDDKSVKECFTHLELNNLHFLNLYSNKLNDCSIFKIIEKFSNLKELYVGNNDLKIFDENDKYNLPNIQEIGLSDGTFEKVPIETLSKFTFKNLKKINLDNNYLRSLSFIEKLECRNLEEIYFNDNEINKFESFGNKFNFKKIELKNNKIVDLDGINNFINSFPQLIEINLKGNNISLNKNNIDIIKKIILEKNIYILLLNETKLKKN